MMTISAKLIHEFVIKANRQGKRTDLRNNVFGLRWIARENVNVSGLSQMWIECV